MRYVIAEERDDLHQECSASDCNWRGGEHDEPFSNCPLCFSRLIDIDPTAAQR